MSDSSPSPDAQAFEATGIASLRATGIKFDAGFQHGQESNYGGSDFPYLDAGDCE